MSMSAAQRQALLSQWIKPSSENEVDQQERAERMIRNAIKNHSAFNGVSIQIYAKGSYANNTNVRRDSDVDIVVECHELMYYDYQDGVTASGPKASSYTGKWEPSVWRSEVVNALENEFGKRDVDSSGSVAIAVAVKEGSRPSADVVPSFHYRKYWTGDRRSFSDGSRVYKTTSGYITNWPQQQLDNGRAKNDRTGKRYKNFVRALKNVENVLYKGGKIDAVPSYLMECLVWNVADSTLKQGILDTGFRATLIDLWSGLKEGGGYEDWLEPNELKYLFRSSQKWTPEIARQLVKKAWNYLDYS